MSDKKLSEDDIEFIDAGCFLLLILNPITFCLVAFILELFGVSTCVSRHYIGWTIGLLILDIMLAVSVSETIEPTESIESDVGGL